jgi:hypothetical protein
MKRLVAGLCLMALVGSCGKQGSNSSNNLLPKREHTFYATSQRCPLISLLAQSKAQNKPILLYFTAFAEINGRKMEDQIFSSADVEKLMQNEFICFALYTDDRKEITPSYISEFDGDSVTTIGEENMELQQKFCTSSFQPQVVIMRWDESIVGEMGYTYSSADFKDFLKKALNEF